MVIEPLSKIPNGCAGGKGLTSKNYSFLVLDGSGRQSVRPSVLVKVGRVCSTWSNKTCKVFN